MRSQLKSRSTPKRRPSERPPRGGSSRPMSLRISQSDRRLLDQAAAVLSESRTEFILAAARDRAKDVLMDRKHIVLGREAWREFVAALDGPAPEPSPELRRLMTEGRLWD